MAKFNHTFDFVLCIDVQSDQEDSSDVTGSILRDTILSRISLLEKSDFVEMCEHIDTSEEPFG